MYYTRAPKWGKIREIRGVTSLGQTTLFEPWTNQKEPQHVVLYIPQFGARTWNFLAAESADV